MPETKAKRAVTPVSETVTSRYSIPVTMNVSMKVFPEHGDVIIEGRVFNDYNIPVVVFERHIHPLDDGSWIVEGGVAGCPSMPTQYYDTREEAVLASLYRLAEYAERDDNHSYEDWKQLLLENLQTLEINNAGLVLAPAK